LTGDGEDRIDNGAEQVSSLSTKFVPAIGWIRTYDTSWLSGDFIAALTVWALLVPEAMAYATLAGVPPEAGLYAAPLALLGYALFGTSRQLIVGPSSTVAILSAAIVLPLAGGDTQRFIELTAALAITTGLICVVLGVIKGGVLADFMSGPVMRGFIIGLAITILLGQLDKLFGIEPEVEGVVGELVYYVTHLGSIQWLTFAIGVASLALLFAIERFAPKVPGALVVLVLSIVTVSVFGLEELGVEIVGDIPAGLPPIGLPTIELGDIPGLAMGGLAVAIVGFAESVGAAKTYAHKHDYEIDANQELIGLGAANIGAGLSQGFVVDGSLSKSSAADQAGQRTQMASLIDAGLVLVTIVALTPLFHNLPEAALGAIVIHAVFGLVRPGKLMRYRKLSAFDFWSAVAALLGVLFLGILPGLGLAILVSLLGVLARATRPHTAELGMITGSLGQSVFVDVAEHTDARTYEGLPIYRFDGGLFFANVPRFRTDVLALAADESENVRAVLVDSESITDADTTAVDMLLELERELAAQGVTLAFARVRVDVRSVLKQGGVVDAVGEEHFYLSVRSGVAALTAEFGLGDSGTESGGT
jgi:SulP family sulfate permease